MLCWYDETFTWTAKPDRTKGSNKGRKQSYYQWAKTDTRHADLFNSKLSDNNRPNEKQIS